MSTYTMDNNPEIELFRNIGGRDLKFFSRIHYGGGAACAPIMHAAMAVATIMLVISFIMLFIINLIQAWSRKRYGYA